MSAPPTRCPTGWAWALAELALAVGVGAAVLALGDGVAVQATTGALKAAFLWDVPVTGWLGLTPSGGCQSPGETAVSGVAGGLPPPGEDSELVRVITVCCTVCRVTKPTTTTATTAETASTGRSQGRAASSRPCAGRERLLPAALPAPRRPAVPLNSCSSWPSADRPARGDRLQPDRQPDPVAAAASR